MEKVIVRQAYGLAKNTDREAALQIIHYCQQG